MNATGLYVVGHVFPIVAALLPQMASREAFALLAAIALQESKFRARRQYGNGPARGFWQFELGGVEAVLEHLASRDAARGVCDVLGYPADERAIHLALEHSDVLAACFARLLLWTDPRALPGPERGPDAWLQYLACWRPGKPHAATVAQCFSDGWKAVQA